MLSPEQAELLRLIQDMAPDQVHRVLEFTRKVKEEPPIDYSDDWTEEDMREASNDALCRLDEIDPYDWPDQEDMNGALSPPQPEGGK